MTERLSEELRQLGDRTPELRVPGDAWSRGRRARNRDRLLTGVFVASLVVLAGTLLRITPASEVAAELVGPEAEAELGVPDRVWPQTELEPSPDLAVGVTALAFVSELEGVVTVSASDGGYRALLLPRGPVDMLPGAAEGSVALDTGGRLLAYGWLRENDDEGPEVLTGVDVLDLTTGKAQRFRIEGGAGVVVTDLVWSPDSRWLAWRGLQTRSLSASGGSVAAQYGPAAYGRLDLGSGAIVQATLPQVRVRGVSVDDAGRVWILGSRPTQTLPSWASRPQAPQAPEALQSTVPAAPGGDRVVLASGQDLRITVSGLATSTYDELELAADAYPHGGHAHPVGWIDASHALVRLVELGEPDGDYHPVAGESLAVVDLDGGQAEAHVDPVVEFDSPEGSAAVTVATDLMSLDRPTVSRPDPRPVSPWRIALVGAMIALVIGLAAALVVRRRQRP